ncbi:hypothetical protein [Oleidesulfovibrio sp.]|uniref:hypothetical protein n=1 Tax=Oleidesulfovibrio sp. TaxID=2909707 RepID=UPI003A85C3B9
MQLTFRAIAASVARCALCFIAFSFLTFLVTSQAVAANKTEKQLVPQDSEQVLTVLLNAVSAPSASISAENIKPLLELVVGNVNTPNNLPQPEKRDAGSGIFMRSTINVPFDKFLEYCYNPAISPAALFPASVRLGYWKDGSDILKGVKLWEKAENLDSMVVLRGSEYEEITPDHFSGCYYGYDLNRLVILMPWNNRRVLISISRQAAPSTIGMKGAIVGEDTDWEYVYTTEEGGTARSIGWMDTYMYDSASVAFFFDDESGSATHYAMFKWLKAGWAGLNVVKKSHIISGTERFLNGFKGVIESPELPSAGQLEAYIKDVRSQDDNAQIASLAEYSAKLEAISKEDDILKRSDFQDVLKGGSYASTLTPEQRVSVLIKQFIKRELGKPAFASL